MNIFEQELAYLPEMEDKNQGDIRRIRKVTKQMYETDQVKLVKFILYICGITRKPVCNGKELEEVFHGKGLRNNAYWRIHEVARLDKNLAMSIIKLLPTFNSWRMVFDLIYFDIMVRGYGKTYLDLSEMAVFIAKGLQDSNHKQYVLKYLPNINNKSKSKRNKAKLIFAKYFCSLLFGAKDEKNQGKTYKMYRKLKNQCKIIDWQKKVSNQEYDFDITKLSKRAVKLKMTKKFLRNKPEIKSQYDLLKNSFMSKKEEFALDPKSELEFAFNQELMDLVII